MAGHSETRCARAYIERRKNGIGKQHNHKSVAIGCGTEMNSIKGRKRQKKEREMETESCPNVATFVPLSCDSFCVPLFRSRCDDFSLCVRLQCKKTHFMHFVRIMLGSLWAIQCIRILIRSIENHRQTSIVRDVRAPFLANASNKTNKFIWQLPVPSADRKVNFGTFGSVKWQPILLKCTTTLTYRPSLTWQPTKNRRRKKHTQNGNKNIVFEQLNK